MSLLDCIWSLWISTITGQHAITVSDIYGAFSRMPRRIARLCPVVGTRVLRPFATNGLRLDALKRLLAHDRARDVSRAQMLKVHVNMAVWRDRYGRLWRRKLT